MTYSSIKEVFNEMRALMLVNGYSAYALNEIEKTFNKAVNHIKRNCENCEYKNRVDCYECNWSWNGD